MQGSNHDRGDRVELSMDEQAYVNLVHRDMLDDARQTEQTMGSDWCAQTLIKSILMTDTDIPVQVSKRLDHLDIAPDRFSQMLVQLVGRDDDDTTADLILQEDSQFAGEG